MNDTPMIKASLAPMAGYTDSAFRKLCKSFGAYYAVSEMISAVALTMGDRKTASLAEISVGEGDIVLQIFGHKPEEMAKAVKILLSGEYEGCSYAVPPAGIDINMGCPVRKIVTSGDGSALMRDVGLAREITAAAKESARAFGVPLSVKFRAGWDRESINAPFFAAEMAKAGADRLTVHCRTREQMYMPSADVSVAGKVHLALMESGLRDRVVLVGNGDIDSAESAKAMLSVGCDEVAVGRAALGNPWIFKELASGEDYVPTDVEVADTVLWLVRELTKKLGEERGILEARGRAAHFITSRRGAAKLRDTLNHTTTLSSFEQTLRDFFG